MGSWKDLKAAAIERYRSMSHTEPLLGKIEVTPSLHRTMAVRVSYADMKIFWRNGGKRK